MTSVFGSEPSSLNEYGWCSVPSCAVTVLDPFLADDQSQIQSSSNDQSKSDKTLLSPFIRSINEDYEMVHFRGSSIGGWKLK